MDTNILQLIQRAYPNIAEKKLQEEMAEVGQMRYYKEGQTIMDYGTYVRYVPLLVKGSIKVMRQDEEGNEILLYYLYPGEACSMSFTCCMINKKSDIRTEATEDSEIVTIPLKFIDLWIGKYQSWKNFILRSYDERFKELIRTIDSIAFKKMDERLLEYLSKRGDLNKSPIIHVTHQEIAFDLNASREAISRLLKQLEKDNKVKLGRNKIELINI